MNFYVTKRDGARKPHATATYAVHKLGSTTYAEFEVLFGNHISELKIRDHISGGKLAELCDHFDLKPKDLYARLIEMADEHEQFVKGEKPASPAPSGKRWVLVELVHDAEHNKERHTVVETYMYENGAVADRSMCMHDPRNASKNYVILEIEV